MSEHDEQAAFVNHVLWTYSSRADFFRPLFFAVPNGAMLGGQNKFALLNKLKQEGFTPGVADILYLQPRGTYAFLAIEMKTQNGKLSAEQETFLSAAQANGGCAAVCYGEQHAIEQFAAYMQLPLKSKRKQP